MCSTIYKNSWRSMLHLFSWVLQQRYFIRRHKQQSHIQHINFINFKLILDQTKELLSEMANSQKSPLAHLEEYTRIMNIIKVYYNTSKDQQLKVLKKKFKWLNDVNTVIYEKPNNRMDLQQIRCCFCDLCLPNQLMILVHFELVHPQKSLTYEIDERCLMIKRPEKIQDPRLSLFSQAPVPIVQGDFSKRIEAFLNKLLGKLNKIDQQQTKIKFYHSQNIFQQKKVQQNDEDSESECEDLMGQIRQIERDRIQDFVDITKNEKQLFILWNTHSRGARVAYGNNHMFKHNQLIQELKAFIREEKIKPLRTSFLVHLNVLWSYGRISSNDVLELIHEFDKYHDI